MRTIKALACAAALVAGLATTAVAQGNVYSLNVVGYYNIVAPAGQAILIANQLNTTNNTIKYLFPNGPVGSVFYKFSSGNWVSSTFDPDLLAWDPDENMTLNPGEAGMFKAGTDSTLTFVGEVQQGALSVALTSGGAAFTAASIVPQTGLLTTDLNFPGQPGDIAYKFANGNWASATWDPDLDFWDPAEPTFGVGEGMMLKKNGAATAWTRNFTVQ